jgi:hypothetical protein
VGNSYALEEKFTIRQRQTTYQYCKKCKIIVIAKNSGFAYMIEMRSLNLLTD